MPRTNPGLDYFPLDVDIDNDDKIELIEAKHGIIGFAVIIRLFMKVYRNGYYYQWGEKEQLLFSKRLNVDINTLNAIIDDAIEWEIFNRDMFEMWMILTSKGIQRRYLEAAKRRQKVELNAEYLLLTENCLNAYNNVLIVNINPDNVDISTQSKVKESKVNSTSSENKFPDDSLEMKMTKFMIDKILESYPSAKVPKTESQLYKWALTFNRLMRIDNRSIEDIRAVMKWIYQDDFWCVQIRSPDKLREKWDTVYLQMTGKNNKKNDYRDLTNNQKLREEAGY
jgi:hypothetical protein